MIIFYQRLLQKKIYIRSPLYNINSLNKSYDTGLERLPEKK